MWDEIRRKRNDIQEKGQRCVCVISCSKHMQVVRDWQRLVCVCACVRACVHVHVCSHFADTNPVWGPKAASYMGNPENLKCFFGAKFSFISSYCELSRSLTWLTNSFGVCVDSICCHSFVFPCVRLWDRHHFSVYISALPHSKISHSPPFTLWMTSLQIKTEVIQFLATGGNERLSLPPSLFPPVLPRTTAVGLFLAKSPQGSDK